MKFLDTDKNPLLEEESGRSSLLTDQYIQVQNNLAQVHLLNDQYEQCLDAVNQVLRHDSTNVKALFRQAKALFALGNYDEAIEPLRTLMESENKEVEKEKVKKMLQICETKLARYKKNEKDICRRMFASTTSENAEKTASVIFFVCLMDVV